MRPPRVRAKLPKFLILGVGFIAVSTAASADIVMSCGELFRAGETREICINCVEDLSISAQQAREYLTRDSGTCDSYDVIVRGEITERDVAAFEMAISADIETLGVGYTLDSTGGDVEAAMAIGDSFYRNSLLANVRRCLSACVLILAGAISRHYLPNAVVGVHSVFPADVAATDYESSRNDAARWYDKIERWLAAFGVSTSVVDAMRSVPSSQMRLLNPKELESVGLGGQNAAYEDRVRFHVTRACGPAEYSRYISEPTVQLEIQKKCAPETLWRNVRPQ